MITAGTGEFDASGVDLFATVVKDWMFHGLQLVPPLVKGIGGLLHMLPPVKGVLPWSAGHEQFAVARFPLVKGCGCHGDEWSTRRMWRQTFALCIFTSSCHQCPFGEPSRRSSPCACVRVVFVHVAVGCFSATSVSVFHWRFRSFGTICVSSSCVSDHGQRASLWPAS